MRLETGIIPLSLPMSLPLTLSQEVHETYSPVEPTHRCSRLAWNRFKISTPKMPLDNLLSVDFMVRPRVLGTKSPMAPTGGNGRSWFGNNTTVQYQRFANRPLQLSPVLHSCTARIVSGLYMVIDESRRISNPLPLLPRPSPHPP